MRDGGAAERRHPIHQRGLDADGARRHSEPATGGIKFSDRTGGLRGSVSHKERHRHHANIAQRYDHC